MNKKPLHSLLFCVALIPVTAWAHEFDGARPDAHAPISIMGEHTHNAREWMLSYRYMFMDMDGMQTGTDAVTSSEVFAANYTVTPERMTMDMHMFGLMHAPSDRLTLMAMIPFKEIAMDHRIFPNALPLISLNGGIDTFTTRSEGFGDFKSAALYQFWNKENQRAHFGFGISLPTGSIGQKDLVPGPGGRIDRQLPSPMQLGSGTVDLFPSLTFLAQQENWSFGFQGNGIIRLGENHHNYRLGHEFNATTWLSWKVGDAISIASKIKYRTLGEIEGVQSDLSFHPPFAPARRTVPTAFSENYGGESLDLGFSLNYLVRKGKLRGNRIAFEWSVPVWQKLNGFQLQTDYIMTLGWQFAWK